MTIKTPSTWTAWFLLAGIVAYLVTKEGWAVFMVGYGVGRWWAEGKEVC